MFCDKCKEQLRENTVFCGNCGTKVISEMYTRGVQSTIQKRNHVTSETTQFQPSQQSIVKTPDDDLSGNKNKTQKERQRITHIKKALIITCAVLLLSITVAFALGLFVPRYRISFYLDDGTDARRGDSVRVRREELVNEPKPPIREGYEFLYWADGEEKFDFSTIITKSINLYARWIVTHNVVYRSNDGMNMIVGETFVRDGDNLEVITPPEREGYAFLFWSKEPLVQHEFDLRVPITEPVVLYAQWIPVHIITMLQNDGTDLVHYELTVRNEENGHIPVMPVRSGYEFQYWSTNPNGGLNFDFTLPITEPLVLYAQWIALHTITMYLNNSTDTIHYEITVRNEEAGYIPPMPMRAGYKFLHWSDRYYNGEPFEFHSLITNDISLYALWEPEHPLGRVAAGNGSSFAINPDGQLWAWGDNDRGQLGDGTAYDRRSPVKIMDNVIAVSAGSKHTLALKEDGTLWSWGNNNSGQIGDGTITISTSVRGIIENNNRHSPVMVKENVIAISAWNNQSLAITSDGDLWAWGEQGASGDYFGAFTISYGPSPVRIMGNVIAVSAGNGHVLALVNDGSLWGWGMNGFGQIGPNMLGSSVSHDSPNLLMENVIAISAGHDHSLAIQSDGGLWSWGANAHGQVGAGSRRDTSRPYPTRILDNVSFISAGRLHSMAITDDGTVWGWGSNTHGIIGDGTTTFAPNANPPITIPTRVIGNVVYISAGHNHTLAICNNGNLWTWGENRQGQLGNGTTINQALPTQLNWP